MDLSLNPNDAWEFIENKLQIRKAKEIFSSNRLTVLCKVNRALNQKLAFQSYSMTSIAKSSRQIPFPAQILDSGLSLEGGVCFSNNCFAFALVNAIGFEASLLEAKFSASSIEANHAAVLLKNLCETGDRYLLDVGSGYPSFYLVDLGGLPRSRVTAGLHYKYVEEDKKVLRLHHYIKDKGENEDKLIIRGDWCDIFQHYIVPTVPFSHYREPMQMIYISDDSPFFTRLRAVRFPIVSQEVIEMLKDESIDLEEILDVIIREDAMDYDSKCLTVIPEPNSKLEENEETNPVSKHEDEITDVPDGICLAMVNHELMIGPMCALRRKGIPKERYLCVASKSFPFVPKNTIEQALKNAMHVVYPNDKSSRVNDDIMSCC